MVAIGSQWLTAIASGSQWQKNQPLPASKPFGILSLPMVQLAFNGTNGNIYNGIIGKTLNTLKVYNSSCNQVGRDLTDHVLAILKAVGFTLSLRN